jgi:hypothetical protein
MEGKYIPYNFSILKMELNLEQKAVSCQPCFLAVHITISIERLSQQIWNYGQVNGWMDGRSETL